MPRWPLAIPQHKTPTAFEVTPAGRLAGQRWLSEGPVSSSSVLSVTAVGCVWHHSWPRKHVVARAVSGGTVFEPRPSLNGSVSFASCTLLLYYARTLWPKAAIIAHTSIPKSSAPLVPQGCFLLELVTKIVQRNSKKDEETGEESSRTSMQTRFWLYPETRI